MSNPIKRTLLVVLLVCGLIAVGAPAAEAGPGSGQDCDVHTPEDAITIGPDGTITKDPYYKPIDCKY